MIKQDIIIYKKKMIQIEPFKVRATIKYHTAKIQQTYPLNEPQQQRSYNKSIKMLMDEYLTKYFESNSITIPMSCKNFIILEDKKTSFSAEIGNYEFDPFHNSIEIELSREDGDQFSPGFKVHQLVSINHQYVDQSKWKTKKILTGGDSIQLFVQVVCDQNQADSEAYEQILKQFRKYGGATKISQLFSWSLKDFERLKILINYQHLMFEMVQEIKLMSAYQCFSKKPVDFRIKVDKEKCLRVGNSHKVLRYLIFQFYGYEELQKVAPLNFTNVQNAIITMKKMIQNLDLLDQLEDYFFEFTVSAAVQNHIDGGSRGLILYGPPGTGKTVLTETLPQLMGFHLISKGLSSADFMKSLVGKQREMVQYLVNRAKLSPYLQCSIGIDQFEALAADRTDKDEKHTVEGVSMFLSVIGGNKDVPNLIFMTSTNHLNKIDSAIIRRLNGVFQVGRLSPDGRKIIIQNSLEYFKNQNHSQQLEYLILITTNFTGAAIQKLNKKLALILQKKSMLLKGSIKLSHKQISSEADKIAKIFKITLGLNTIPEIYDNQKLTKFVCSKDFLNKIYNRFLLVSCKRDKFFQLHYAIQMRKAKYNQQQNKSKVDPYFGVGEQNFIFDLRELNRGKNQEKQKKPLQNARYLQNKPQLTIVKALEQWLIDTIGDQFEIEICEKEDQISKRFKARLSPTILILEEKSEGSLHGHFQFFENPKEYLFVFYLIHHPPMNYIELFNWEADEMRPYTGRILIELTEEPKVAYELIARQPGESKLYLKHWLKTEKSKNPSDVIPELVEFFRKRNVSYLLYLDHQLLNENNVHDEQKKSQIICEKMTQASKYNQVAVIINIDSLTPLCQTISDSSMGRSFSYSLADHQIYFKIINYVKEFSKISSYQEGQKLIKQEKWIVLISQNQNLITMIKQDLNWPKTSQDEMKEKKQKELDDERKCMRCGLYYTQRENKKERKCMQHPGLLIDMRGNQKNITQIQIEEAKVFEIKYKKLKQEKKIQHLYIFACCLKGIHEPGETAYRHIGSEEKDEHLLEKNRRKSEWNNVCKKFNNQERKK